MCRDSVTNQRPFRVWPISRAATLTSCRSAPVPNGPKKRLRRHVAMATLLGFGRTHALHPTGWMPAPVRHAILGLNASPEASRAGHAHRACRAGHHHRLISRVTWRIMDSSSRFMPGCPETVRFRRAPTCRGHGQGGSACDRRLCAFALPRSSARRRHMRPYRGQARSDPTGTPDGGRRSGLRQLGPHPAGFRESSTLDIGMRRFHCS